MSKAKELWRYIKAHLAFAWRTEQARTVEQADLAEQGQGTEFARAMEMLGDERLAVRLDGICALERMAKDSLSSVHWKVMEVLCSYLHVNRPISEAEGEEVPPDPMPKDIQAILTVLRRRDSSMEKPLEWLDFAGVNLRGANLRGANLRGANFIGANLEGANLEGANLQDPDLPGGDQELSDCTLMLTQDQLNKANGNADTILPDNLKHPDHWPD